jgi:hypothetical protein
MPCMLRVSECDVRCGGLVRLGCMLIVATPHVAVHAVGSLWRPTCGVDEGLGTWPCLASGGIYGLLSDALPCCVVLFALLRTVWYHSRLLIGSVGP